MTCVFGGPRSLRSGIFLLVLMIGCSSPDKTTNPVPDPGERPLTFAEPVWSVDGLIAYRDKGTRFENGEWRFNVELAGIWVFDPGSGIHRQIADFGDSPAWSPDGGRLVFREQSSIWLHDIVLGKSARLLEMDGFCNPPSWRPCGGSIIFSSTQESPFDYTAWLFSLENEALENVTPGVGGLRYPSWFAGCDSILVKKYVYHEGEIGSGIYVSGLRSNEWALCFASDLDERGVEVSSSGRFVGFHSVTGNDSYGLFVFDRFSGMFPVDGAFEGEDLSWNPTSEQFLFVREKANIEDGLNAEVVVFDLESRQWTVLF